MISFFILIFWLLSCKTTDSTVCETHVLNPIYLKPIFIILHDQTVQAINKMKPQFEDLDSDLDDTAADYIAEAMMMVLQDQGYFEIEMEELIATREW